MDYKENIKRIEHMEVCFDQLLLIDDLNVIYDSNDLKIKVRNLIHYVESKMWLEDYELDEHHLLPDNLKRGVLSQDMLYNFLENIDISKL